MRKVKAFLLITMLLLLPTVTFASEKECIGWSDFPKLMGAFGFSESIIVLSLAYIASGYNLIASLIAAALVGTLIGALYYVAALLALYLVGRR
ncbi:hypothetical protein IPA_08620 [Ignicoccus pacificus DSM 13166]|uniref:Uncharacterized protein n=1 Tax=Ignicoccus pacificus DSM 13166 TaxID=940294 RepID=A0A977KCQ0_9CREN|nr:hypothetical protein IPA_08620 [Ignicoccus pacificus DSM 13166]